MIENNIYFTCNNLSFNYHKKEIFNNISFNIKCGDVIALVGNNGTGKTTLLKIMIGYLKKNNINTNMKISYLVGNPSFYPYLTGYQNLKYYQILNNLPEESIDKVLHITGLYDDRNIKYKKYSLGMKERLAISKCLLNDADLYLFDEPLNGLDPEGIILFRKIINYLKECNKTIVISSHILKELDYCNKIFFIDNKRLMEVENTGNNLENLFKLKEEK